MLALGLLPRRRRVVTKENPLRVQLSNIIQPNALAEPHEAIEDYVIPIDKRSVEDYVIPVDKRGAAVEDYVIPVDKA